MADFIALVTYYTPDKGGRKTPVSTGDRAMIQFEGREKTVLCELGFDKELVFAGETEKGEITLVNKDLFTKFLYEGLSFVLSEGHSPVGSGTVLTLLNTDLSA